MGGEEKEKMAQMCTLESRNEGELPSFRFSLGPAVTPWVRFLALTSACKMWMLVLFHLTEEGR